jgi:hypothetical protein
VKRTLAVLGKTSVIALAAMLLGAQIVVEYYFYKASPFGVADLFSFFPEWLYPLLSAGQFSALVYIWFKRATLKWWWYLVLLLIALSVSTALTLFSPEVHGWIYYHRSQVVFD